MQCKYLSCLRAVKEWVAKIIAEIFAVWKDIWSSFCAPLANVSLLTNYSSSSLEISVLFTDRPGILQTLRITDQPTLAIDSRNADFKHFFKGIIQPSPILREKRNDIASSLIIFETTMFAQGKTTSQTLINSVTLA